MISKKQARDAKPLGIEYMQFCFIAQSTKEWKSEAKIVVSLKKKEKKESQRWNLTIATVKGSNVECNKHLTKIH